MDESPAPRFTVEERGEPQGGSLLPWLKVVLLITLPLMLLCSALGPMAPGYRGGQDVWLQRVHTLGLALFYYSHDNPREPLDGASSTEIFQKLMDGGYIRDPMVFYAPMRGKVAPEPGQKQLKPENVCFDVTGGVGLQDSIQIPLVYLTGFRVTYTPGSAARPLGGVFPFFEVPHHFLFFSWKGPEGRPPGIVVFYNSLDAAWILAQGDSIPNFVPSSFDAHGKTYRQLTPDGVLR